MNRSVDGPGRPARAPGIQAVHRTYSATVNAQLQTEALRPGTPIYLEEEEARLSAAANDFSAERAWALWKGEVGAP